jgi:hypothetical protein
MQNSIKILLALLVGLAVTLISKAQLSVVNGALTGPTTMPLYFPMGEMTITNNAVATTIASSGVYYQMNGTTKFNSAVGNQFDMPSNGRLRYTGTPTIMAHIACTLSYVVSAGSNQECRFVLYKNGVKVEESEIRNTLSSTAGQSSAIHVALSLATNDYLELYCVNNTAANNLTATTVNLFALGLK